MAPSNEDDDEQHSEGGGEEEAMMTPEERLAWLRERGIQITTPEDRRSSANRVATANSNGGGGRGGVIGDTNHNADAVAATTTTTTTTTEEEAAVAVSYVKIPADSSQPLKELSFDPGKVNVVAGSIGIRQVGAVDLLMEHLKPVFAKRADQHVDTSLLSATGGGKGGGRQISQLLASSSSSSGNNNRVGNDDNPLDDSNNMVSESALQKTALEGHVEAFCLVRPVESNGYTAVNMYLDEIGMLKRLPANARAAKYAEAAGYDPPPTFYGDVYVGRLEKKRGLFNQKHVSLALGRDTSPDASWLRAAAEQNLQYQAEQNKLTGKSSSQQQQQPSYAGQDGSAQQEDSYSWTQTEEELEVVVPLPSGALSKRDIKVQFRPKSCRVMLKSEILIANLNNLFAAVDVDGCTWTIEETTSENKDDKQQRQLVITMEKSEPGLWPRIVD